MIRGLLLRLFVTVAGWRDCSLADATPAPPVVRYDFREPRIDLKARIEGAIVEAKASKLVAEVEFWDLAGRFADPRDAGRLARAFGADVTA